MSPVIKWTDRIEDAENSGSGFTPLEEGTYDFVIEQPATVGETQKGNSKFTINPSVESGPRKNARIFHTFYVSDSGGAMKRFFFAPLAAMGLTLDYFKTEPSDSELAQAMQGRRFRATVVLKEGQDGVKRPELENFLPAQGAAPQAGVPQPGVPSTPAQSAPSVPQQPAQTAAPQAPQPTSASPWDTTPPPPPAF